jgi:hypothetical protein
MRPRDCRCTGHDFKRRESTRCPGRFAPGATTHPDVALLRRKTGILETNGLPSEEDPVLAEFFFEDLILGTEALDDFSLTAVAPTSEDGEQRLPGLEDEVHSGPDVAVTTSKASGLEEDLSSV